LPDGEYSNYRFQEINTCYKDSIFDFIGVGIIHIDRRRDLLYIHGADKFLDFITLELIPTVEKGYEVKTRILFGHSFAGAFTIYSLLNKPADFDCYIASSPTPIMKLIDKGKYLHADSIVKNKIVFHHSYGSGDMGQVRRWSKKLNDNLTGFEFKHLEYRFTIFEGRNHNNSDIAALINGLHNMN
jgi:enterochelin esterase-like enzyme